jgi:hypothetical protein
MPAFLTYTVTPVADALNAVRIKTQADSSPFVDDSEDLILQALSPETLPLMQAYLAGLSLDTSWTRRESRASSYIRDGAFPDSDITVCLNRYWSNKRTPDTWFGLLTYREHRDFLLEINMRDERLAEQMFEAVVAETLRIEYA